MHRLTHGTVVPEKGLRNIWTHLVFATVSGLALRLFFIWRFPNEFADSVVYEELARNWLDHRVYGVFLDGTLTPILIRVPGYPAFLAIVYLFLGRSLLAVMLAQIALDIGTCFLSAMLAASLVPKSLHRRVFLAALWLAATCPFVAMYTAVPMTEVLVTFLTTAALVLLVRIYQVRDASRGLRGHQWRASPWFLAGLLIGLGTLVRPETPLLLVAASLVLFLRWRYPADWPKFFRSVALIAAGLILPLLPWGARNWETFHRIQFLAPRYYAMPGDYVPRGFYAWTNTWLVRMRDAFQVYWRLEDDPIPIENVPASAFDSPEERARVQTLLERYNATIKVTPEIDGGFGELARQRSARHPLRTYVWIPARRAVSMWFTPHGDLLPYSGHLWPPAEHWKEEPLGFSVIASLALLNIFYLALALLALWRWRWSSSGIVLLVAFIMVRTAYMATVETPEPRYILECFPAVLSLASLAWGSPSNPNAK